MFNTIQLLTGAIIVTSVLVACGDSDSLVVTDAATLDNPDVQSPGAENPVAHTAHTGPAAGVWPPQPESMSNPEPYPSSARAGVLSGVLGAARRSILNNPIVQASLGSDFREIEASFGDSKGTDIASIVFYNYATDETVDVAFGKDGSVSSQVFPADVYQPAEHVEEKEDAIALARAALIASSFDVSNLQPAVMLAFPPASEVKSEQQHFYPQRTMYVTFGDGEGALPVYSALVDLSSSTVVEHGLIK